MTHTTRVIVQKRFRCDEEDEGSAGRLGKADKETDGDQTGEVCGTSRNGGRQVTQVVFSRRLAAQLTVSNC